MIGGQIRILIADDQALFAEGLKTILESRAPDIIVAGIAKNGQEAISLAEELQPDIILMDVRMPLLDGVEATKAIHRKNPGQKIVMLTTFPDDEYVQFSLSNGAIGYLLKNRPPVELIASIRAVMGGILQIDPAVSESLIKRDNADGHHDDDDFIRYLNSLTKREREVLRLLVNANDNRQIAEKLAIAEQTVKNYISIIYGKLGITNRIEIMRYMDKVQFYLEHN
jgi:DNA-binding NarL/FixJ family response regulator